MTEEQLSFLYKIPSQVLKEKQLNKAIGRLIQINDELLSLQYRYQLPTDKKIPSTNRCLPPNLDYRCRNNGTCVWTHSRNQYTSMDPASPVVSGDNVDIRGFFLQAMGQARQLREDGLEEQNVINPYNDPLVNSYVPSTVFDPASTPNTSASKRLLTRPIGKNLPKVPIVKTLRTEPHSESSTKLESRKKDINNKPPQSPHLQSQPQQSQSQEAQTQQPQPQKSHSQQSQPLKPQPQKSHSQQSQTLKPQQQKSHSQQSQTLKPQQQKSHSQQSQQLKPQSEELLYSLPQSKILLSTSTSYPTCIHPTKAFSKDYVIETFLDNNYSTFEKKLPSEEENPINLDYQPINIDNHNHKAISQSALKRSYVPKQPLTPNSYNINDIYNSTCCHNAQSPFFGSLYYKNNNLQYTRSHDSFKDSYNYRHINSNINKLCMNQDFMKLSQHKSLYQRRKRVKL